MVSKLFGTVTSKRQGYKITNNVYLKPNSRLMKIRTFIGMKEKPYTKLKVLS